MFGRIGQDLIWVASHFFSKVEKIDGRSPYFQRQPLAAVSVAPVAHGKLIFFFVLKEYLGNQIASNSERCAVPGSCVNIAPIGLTYGRQAESWAGH